MLKKYNIILILFASIFFVNFQNAMASGIFCTKYSNVNFRNGPGTKFVIIYKIFRKGYPVKVIDTIDGWNAVEDFKGDKMWVSNLNLSAKCGRIIKSGKVAEVKIRPDANSLTVKTLEEGFIIDKIRCHDVWCEVEIEKNIGWILKDLIWE